MGFVVYFALTWLFVSIFVAIEKKGSLVENTFVFLIILIVNINFTWVIAEEMNFIVLTKEGINYTGYILNRSMLIPILLVIQLNLIQGTKSMIQKISIILISVCFLLVLSILSIQLDMTEYTNWNHLNDAIYYFTLHLVAIFTYRLFKKISPSEVNVL
ncbi:hypothetical protein [Sutcliffiella halmapala]|uniref:hypothetical protein n=1 Tax=Sutcliffiella halmapala TaxID=79882 RepID=UPI0009954893|nr:hypothetical protein [Sutcliffiella halmapala]